jgi:hypothetical protein
VSLSLQFSTTRIVAVSNDAVWRVLGDFGTEHRWTKTLASCERDTATVGVGTVRLCKLSRPLMGRTEARETLTEFDPERVLAYRLDGPAGPFATAASRWSTRREAANSTEITIRGDFEAKNWTTPYFVWPLARIIIRRVAARVLGELEDYLTAHAPPPNWRHQMEDG